MRDKPNRGGKNIKTGTSNKSNNKLSLKKPLKVNNAKQPDNSILRPPIETSVSGLKQAVKLFETGTPEILHLMTFECDVIYECRFCRNLFRSLANFISHKRVYCTKRFNHVEASKVAEDHTIFYGESSGSSLPQRITAKQDLTSIMETSAAQYYKKVEDSVRCRNESRCDTTVHLQPIESTSYGVYQTINNPTNDKLMKNQVSELNQIISSNEGVTLGPDGKIISDLNTPVSDVKKHEHVVSHLTCSLCKVEFSSKKTLNLHTKTVHESFRVVYTCPCCKNVFTNTWSVHRHLAKVHHKSIDQIRKLKLQVQKKQIRSDLLTKKFSKKIIATNKLMKVDEVYNKQPELLKCEICGREFGRRSSFTTHTQICLKRMKSGQSINSKQREEKHLDLHDSVAGTSKHQTSQGHQTPNHKMQIEKRIGIQVRMNYCKDPSSIVTRRSERHRSCEDKDDDNNETLSNISSTKDRLIWQSNESLNKIKIESRRNSEEKSCLDSSVKPEPNSRARANRIKKRRLEDISLQLRMAACQESEHISKKSPNKTSVNTLSDITPRNDNLRKSESRLPKCTTNKNCINPKDNAILIDCKNSNNTLQSPVSCFDQSIDSEPRDNESLKKLSESVSENSIEKDCVGILTRYKVRSIFKPDESTTDTSNNENSHEVELCNTTDESSLKENLNETQNDDYNDDQSSNIEKKLNQYFHYKNKQCLICLRKFKIWPHLKIHVSDHLGLNNFRCLFPDCIFITYSKNECIKHVMKTHLKPQERYRAPSLVGDINQPDKVNCDMDDRGCKRPRSLSDNMDNPKVKVLKETVSLEHEQVGANITVISMNDLNTCDVAREECVQTTRNDSSCSEQSDMDSKLKKRRNARKCSPASASELNERNSKKHPAGAQFRDGKLISELISKKPKS